MCNEGDPEHQIPEFEIICQGLSGEAASYITDRSVGGKGHGNRHARVSYEGEQGRSPILHSPPTWEPVVRPKFSTGSISQFDEHGCIAERDGILIVADLGEGPRPWLWHPPEPRPSTSKSRPEELQVQNAQAADLERATNFRPRQKTVAAVDLVFPPPDEGSTSAVNDRQRPLGKLEDREQMEQEGHEHRSGEGEPATGGKKLRLPAL